METKTIYWRSYDGKTWSAQHDAKGELSNITEIKSKEGICR